MSKITKKQRTYVEEKRERGAIMRGREDRGIKCGQSRITFAD